MLRFVPSGNYYDKINSVFYERKMNRIELWVIKIKKCEDGNIILVESKPCKSCLNILKKYNIGKVWYSTGNGTMKCQKTKEMETNHQCSYNRVNGEPTIKLSK